MVQAPQCRGTHCVRPARRLVALIAASSLLLGLASCSRASDETTDQATTTSSNPELDSTAPAEPIRWEVGLTASDERQQRALDAMTRAGIITTQADSIDPATAVIAANVGESYGIAELSDLRASVAETLAAGGGTVLEQIIGRWLNPEAAIDISQLDALLLAAQSDWIAASQAPVALASLCGFPEFRADWLEQVRPLADGDDPYGYVVSHVALGLAITAERGCTTPEHEQAVDEFARRVADRIPEPFDATDAAIEATVMLELLDRGDLIEPAWFEGILAAQRPNGSWAYRLSPDDPERDETYLSDWHATLLAVWFLGLHAWPEIRGPFFR